MSYPKQILFASLLIAFGIIAPSRIFAEIVYDFNGSDAPGRVDITGNGTGTWVQDNGVSGANGDGYLEVDFNVNDWVGFFFGADPIVITDGSKLHMGFDYRYQGSNPDFEVTDEPGFYFGLFDTSDFNLNVGINGTYDEVLTGFDSTVISAVSDSPFADPGSRLYQDTQFTVSPILETWNHVDFVISHLGGTNFQIAVSSNGSAFRTSNFSSNDLLNTALNPVIGAAYGDADSIAFDNLAWGIPTPVPEPMSAIMFAVVALPLLRRHRGCFV